MIKTDFQKWTFTLILNSNQEPKLKLNSCGKILLTFIYLVNFSPTLANSKEDIIKVFNTLSHLKRQNLSLFWIVIRMLGAP